MNMNKTFLAITMATLVGCGSGGGSDVATVVDGSTPSTGFVTVDDGVAIYSGGITDTQDRTTTLNATKGLDTIVLRFDPRDNNMMYVVIDTVTGSAEFYEATSATVSAVFEFTGYGSADIDEDNGVISGSISFGDDVVATLTADTTTYADQNNLSLSIDDIYNTYLGGVAGTNVSITIDSDGDITGSSGAGCVFSGTTTQLEATKNMFGVTFNISNCDNAGDYVGFTYVISDALDSVYTNLTLTIFNSNNGFYIPLQNY